MSGSPSQGMYLRAYIRTAPAMQILDQVGLLHCQYGQFHYQVKSKLSDSRMERLSQEPLAGL